MKPSLITLLHFSPTHNFRNVITSSPPLIRSLPFTLFRFIIFLLPIILLLLIIFLLTILLPNNPIPPYTSLPTHLSYTLLILSNEPQAFSPIHTDWLAEIAPLARRDWTILGSDPTQRINWRLMISGGFHGLISR